MQPPVPTNELVIRTMKDDMNQMHSVPVVSSSAPVPAAFPLSPKQDKPLPSSIPTSRTKHNIFVGVSCIVVLAGLTAAGWYGYVWWASRQVAPETVQQTRPVAEMIPKEATAIVTYSLDSQSRRTGVQVLWDAKSPVVAGSAIDGDPRELLALQDLTGIYYIVMQDNQRPFLLLQKTEGTDQYVATQSTIEHIEKDGWYILNRIGTDQYTAALDRGTVAEAGSLPVLRSASTVAQYIFTAPYASKLFNEMASDAIGISRISETVFEVDAPSQDGTIRAHAATAIAPVPEKLTPSVAELRSLVPGDAEFGHIGFNFADDVDTWQQETVRLDGSIMQQPAVRQFLSLLNTPYGFFKRTGSDGVRDIGLIIQLPESLQKNLKTGEPIIEQALPAFIPLIVGKALGIQSAFHDGMYGNAPVRYTNITGQTQALDYIVGDSFILISSSREGIGALIDIANEKGDTIQQKDPWKSLFEKSAALVEGKIVSFGRIQDPLLVSLMPIPSGLTQVPVILSEEATSTDSILHATLLIQQ
ncbi:MAG: hypothetical protein A2805_03285 [Candidatus Andersenbacteria bacterium RIFCSPHIGHO2_01_FULL_46_36]|uniref:Uncharacterized protein n=1 Tax=Candidatus Andersenbacteria bacterium RIFCSPHIGHO2_12_FULL_45_11 TaxID=1797281 RepID=A0A1G1X4H8_9BACT|nr:MAG: hypothetical protein A2805_03285 [Candidatus Andersenbacteria bacterium RIFCSPHIGHO2_01_FULL_46_36]OGY34925.1 MAG: hypothetical protein A3D99_03585 [Candidatus Andersenbacteria bacterium RIFCSPHIGHO2_12_FULL_45_11]